eukprot:4691064-Pyramimonas_sp.AAC.1
MGPALHVRIRAGHPHPVNVITFGLLRPQSWGTRARRTIVMRRRRRRRRRTQKRRRRKGRRGKLNRCSCGARPSEQRDDCIEA